MKKFDLLSTNKYLLSSDLERALETGKYNMVKETGCKYYKGIYLLKIKKLKSDGSLIYNYIHYNSMFNDLLLVYIYVRLRTSNLTKDEINSNLFLVDSELSFDNFTYLDDSINIFNNDLSYIVDSIKENFENKLIGDLYNILFKLNFRISNSDIVDVIKLENKNMYYDIIKKLYKNIVDINNDDILDYNNNENFYKYIKSKTFNLVDNCIIVTKDLDKLLNILNDNVKITQGLKSNRGQVNNLSHTLSMLDLDFRNTIYYHYRYHKIEHYLNVNKPLERSKFSFKNIHMNLGSVRY